MKKASKLILFFVLAFFLFPRLIHEPLHLLATNIIGGQGSIHIFTLRPFIEATYIHSDFNVWIFLCFPIFIQAILMTLLSLSLSEVSISTNALLSIDFALQWLGRSNPLSDLRLIHTNTLYSIVVISFMLIGLIMFLIHLFYYIRVNNSKIFK